MKKIFLIIAMLITQLASAEQCNIVLPQRPGGGTDAIIRIMQKYNPDINVHYRPGAYIAPAIAYADQHPETGILALPAMYSKNNPDQTPNVDVIRIVGAYDHGIITSKNITFNDLLTKKLNLGVALVGSPSDIIGMQLKEKNSKIETIAMGGDANALVPLKIGDIDAYVTAWPAVDKWMTEYNFKLLARIGVNNDFVQDNVVLSNISRVSVFMSKNANNKQRENINKCLDTALSNEEVKNEFKKIHLNLLNVEGKEAQKHVQKYIEILYRYGI